MEYGPVIGSEVSMRSGDGNAAQDVATTMQQELQVLPVEGTRPVDTSYVFKYILTHAQARNPARAVLSD